MRLVLANDQGHITVNPGERGYTIELSLHLPGEKYPMTVDLRPEEWAAMNGAVQCYNDEYWETR